jgi:hypothetical protein
MLFQYQDILLLKFKVTWSISLMYWCIMLWHAQMPNWYTFSMLFSSMCLWTIFRITLSNTCVVERRFTGHNIWVNFGSLPGFGKGITFASFQDTGKCESCKHWLNRCVRWTSVLLGRCLRHSFGMLSIPQAFFSLRELISFSMSQGITLSGDCCP